jgi:hypothetical protein
MDLYTNIDIIYQVLNIIDLIDESINHTFVTSKARNDMLKDIIHLIITLYHPERLG